MALRDGSPSMMGKLHDGQYRLCCIWAVTNMLDVGLTLDEALEKWMEGDETARKFKQQKETWRRRYYEWREYAGGHLDPSRTVVPPWLRAAQKAIISFEPPVPFDEGPGGTPSAIRPDRAADARSTTAQDPQLILASHNFRG
ncbi:MAG: hypothetical protein JOZ74_07165 [Bradyrhizobium sp.]|nr:hypothetical protein [Bradyrhizobium sp.]